MNIKEIAKRIIGRKEAGTAGRLEIPELRIGVPLNIGEDAQGIVDRANSAVWMKLGVQDCIADHCHQGGFYRLRESLPGHTVAYIDRDGARTEYICTRAEIGRIERVDGRNRLLDSRGDSVYKQNAGGLCIYTCVGKSTGLVTLVHLTFWEKIKK